LLFYSAMYSVFIPVDPLPLSGASALVPRFALQTYTHVQLSRLHRGAPQLGRSGDSDRRATTIPSGARGKYNITLRIAVA
jgi:hypothetical protein